MRLLQGKTLKNKRNLKLFVILIVSVSLLISFGDIIIPQAGRKIPAPYKVAAIQLDTELGDKTTNVNMLLSMAEEAAQNGAKLIMMPELATTGYAFYFQDEVALIAETVPGDITEKFGDLAKEYGVHIVVTLVEKDPDAPLYFNTAVLIGEEGDVIGKYRKTHQIPQDCYWADWGDLFVPVFSTPIGNIAMIICMDSYFYETFRVAALKGADIVCFPTASAGGAVSHLRARAYENSMYVISCDLAGSEVGSIGRVHNYCGLSAIWGPEGELLAEASGGIPAPGDGKSEIIYAMVDIAKARDKSVGTGNDVFADRRPIDYGYTQLKIFPEESDRRFLPLPPPMNVMAVSIQMKPMLGDKETNLQKMEQLIDDAWSTSENPLNLIVFPEMATTGFVFNDEAEVQPLAEPIPGPSTQRIGLKAQQYGIYIVFGMPEVDGNDLFNTAVLVGPDGEVVGKYRKMHLWVTDENWATPGNLGFPVFNTSIARIGLLIGYDFMFPEAAKIEKINLADIICIPSSWSETQLEWTIIGIYPPKVGYGMVMERARENYVYVILANRYGTEGGVTFTGSSAIYERDARAPMVIAGQTDDSILIAELDTSTVRGVSTHIIRRPELYHTIVSPNPEVTTVTSEVNVEYEELQEKYMDMKDTLQAKVARRTIFSVIAAIFMFIFAIL